MADTDNTLAATLLRIVIVRFFLFSLLTRE